MNLKINPLSNPLSSVKSVIKDTKVYSPETTEELIMTKEDCHDFNNYFVTASVNAGLVKLAKITNSEFVQGLGKLFGG
jgi:hypothetical protein